MRVVKSVISSVVVLYLLVSNQVLAEDSFKDMKGHWADVYVCDMVSEGYIDGYPDNTFKPDRRITKAETGKILCEMFDLPEIEHINRFDDVSENDWYFRYAHSAEMLLDDTWNSTFCGNEDVKRLSAALAIARLWCIDYSADSGSSKIYADYESDSYVDYVSNKNGLISAMTDLGIMNGKGNEFAPDDSLTRAELCAILMRTMKRYGMPQESHLDSYKRKIIDYFNNDIVVEPTPEPVIWFPDEPVWTSEPIYEPICTPEPAETIDIETYRKRVIDLVNFERTAVGVSELSEDSELDKIAQAHSEDMVVNNFFDHINLNGESPFDRMRRFGVTYMYAAENIAYGQNSPEEVVETWMNSEGHKQNILSNKYNHIGVGVAQNERGIIYWTQTFTD